jgi:hypothetical protein
LLPRKARKTPGKLKLCGDRGMHGYACPRPPRSRVIDR